jgi:thiosulfate reductase cytochrome b subunit
MENAAMPSTMTDTAPAGKVLYYRHRLPVRLMHWINVLSLTILFMTGLGIFNAHPSLYWGKSSYSSTPAFLEVGSRVRPGAAASAAVKPAKSEDEEEEEGADTKPAVAASTEKVVTLRAFGREWQTTAFSGSSNQENGIAFPSWLTIPSMYSLADSRSWHFFFAWLFVINGLLYVAYAALSGHLRRDLAPDANDLRGIGASIKDHVRFRHPTGEAAKRYNVLQKLAYLVVIFILLPLIILMGMAMSPALDTVITGWVDWFGGRQSARSIHFIVAWMLVAFVLIHVFEVIISGLWNHLRSMITGYYAVKPEPKKSDPP